MIDSVIETKDDYGDTEMENTEDKASGSETDEGSEKAKLNQNEIQMGSNKPNNISMEN